MRTLLKATTTTTEIKKSRFITHGAPIESTADAMAFIEAVRDPDATHNCWAYKLGSTYRFFDDGEPGGTAGKPILSAIEGSGVDRVAVVVTRFFGGIKLGAGGLVRAYANAAATCLGHAEKVNVVITSEMRFSIPFDAIGQVYPLLEKFGAEKTDEQFGDDRVHYTVIIESIRSSEFETRLRDQTNGKAQFAISDSGSSSPA